MAIQGLLSFSSAPLITRARQSCGSLMQLLVHLEFHQDYEPIKEGKMSSYGQGWWNYEARVGEATSQRLLCTINVLNVYGEMYGIPFAVISITHFKLWKTKVYFASKKS